jgi:hypothetical protein
MRCVRYVDLSRISDSHGGMYENDWLLHEGLTRMGDEKRGQHKKPYLKNQKG